jgi:dienelactone hydrolase
MSLMTRLFLLGLILVLEVSAQADARRKQSLEELRGILAPTVLDLSTGRISARDKTWEEWVSRTGELPPDFESMPSIAGLPDPLVPAGNSAAAPIKTVEQWRRQREWIKSQFERWIFGRMPPPPGNVRVASASEVRETSGVTTRKVLIEFGPGHRAKLHLELMIPPGRGPFPVFLTNQRRSGGWVHTAVRRGYIACIYNATDPKYGDPDDSNDYIDLWPDYDFSGLARWAWAGMRAVDYLVTLPEVNPAQIGITGHSRNGKQALLAAAFDERIAAVVASSGNVGECLPWRFQPDPLLYNGLEAITGRAHNSYWFHPRLRFFAGREHKLPVDQHMMLALVAPRGVMMYSAYAEQEGNPWGFEQSYRSAKPVFRMLGKEDNLWLHLRAGEHAVAPADIENFVNFYDTVFGRKKFPKSETWIHGYTFEAWKALSGDRADPMQFPKRGAGAGASPAKVRENLRWALGEEPPGAELAPRRKLSELAPPDDHLIALLYRRPLRVNGTVAYALPYGEGLKADLHFPAGSDGKPKPGRVPAVVWLHPESYATGYSRQAAALIAELARRGFAVAAFDQIGFGTRVLDAREFYQRYPRWSLMGKMVADTRGVVKALAGLDAIDPAGIALVGYRLGGYAGLLAAASDDRVKAVASIGGFQPLRIHTPARGTEGVRYFSHLHGLIPRLGFFLGHEERLPFDFDEVLALVSPRPALIVSPTLDRHVAPEDARRGTATAAEAYRHAGVPDALSFEAPSEIGRFTPAIQKHVFDWLGARLPDSRKGGLSH